MKLILILLLLTYAGGAFMFWKGFRKTLLVHNLTNRLLFTFLWPVWLINRAGRQHLGRALKGS